MIEIGWQFGFFVYKEDHDDVWRWLDTQEPVTTDRLCNMCNLPPTEEGHDPCLGTIPDAKAACCGHGNWEGYMMDSEGQIVYFPPI